MWSVVIYIMCLLLMVVLIVAVGENYERMRMWMWERKAVKYPNKYDRCVRCGVMKPHKIMMKLKDGMVCDKCLWDK